MQFNHVIRSEADLRAIMGNPVAPPVIEKTLSKLDRHCLTFIDRSPFVLISSASVNGRMDISPRGDAPGFVKVLSENALLIPDRPGNQRFDTFCNLFQNPNVGLIFLIPGKRETLRVSGKAEVIHDPEWLEPMSVQGKTPALAVAVHVEEAFMHCGKCTVRSNIWNSAKWPELDGLSSLAEAMKDAAAVPAPVEALEDIIAEDERSRLY